MVLMVVAGVGVQLAMRRTLNAFRNYSYFVFQSGAMAYFPLVLTVTLMQSALRTSSGGQAVAGSGGKHKAASLLPKFAVMALLDSAEDFLVVVGASKTTVALQSLLPQGILPVTMAVSALWLRTSFSRPQVLSAAFIVAGVLVVVLPAFGVGGYGADAGGVSSGRAGAAAAPGGPAEAQGRHAAQGAPDPQHSSLVFGGLLLFASNIPGALSAVYKQWSLQSAKVNVFYLTTWVTFFQILVGFGMAPINALLPKDDGGMPVSGALTQFRNGARCLFGVDTLVCNMPGPEGCLFDTAAPVGNITARAAEAVCFAFSPDLPNNGDPQATTPHLQPMHQCDTCEGAYAPWVTFVLCVFLYNVVLLLVVKIGNAPFMYAANAVTLPLVNVLATSDLIMGRGAGEQLTWYTVAGLVLMLAGLFAWTRTEVMEDGWSRARRGSDDVLVHTRFACAVPLRAQPQRSWRRGGPGSRRGPRIKGRSALNVRRGLYDALGVSSPGPGRSSSSFGSPSPLLSERSLSVLSDAAGVGIGAGAALAESGSVGAPAYGSFTDAAAEGGGRAHSLWGR